MRITRNKVCALFIASVKRNKILIRPINMTPKEKLFYAFGQMAYSLSKADGLVQNDEKNTFKALLEAEFENQSDINFSEIIFQIFEQDKKDMNSACNEAVEAMSKYKLWLTHEMKMKFLKIMRYIAVASPPLTEAEKTVLKKFEHVLFQKVGA
jgi:uncharacterized tellurite resistance protein B-like protein